MTNLYKIPEIQWQIKDEVVSHAHTVTHEYHVIPFDEDDFVVLYWNKQTQKSCNIDTAPRFKTLEEAKDWVESTHYPTALKKAGFEPVNKPTTVYEIIYDGYDCYYSIMHSLDKSVCERFIQQVQNYDDSYVLILKESKIFDECYDDEALDKWEQNHPLRQWSEEINGEYNQMGYYLAESNFKSYAKNLRIREYTLDKAENK